MNGITCTRCVNFRLNDVRRLARKWMLNLKKATVGTHLNQVYNIEVTFRKSDLSIEELGEDIVDDGDDDDDDDDELDSNMEQTID